MNPSSSQTKPFSSSNDTALITGASSGIGRELAREFARNGHPVVITAPVQSEIDDLARELSADYGIPTTAIACDLCEPEASNHIFNKLSSTGTGVGILVNNAGRGQRGNFCEIPIERDIEMIRLNIEAVVRLTNLFLPPMLARGHGRILNTASIAGFEPGPLMAIYHATKAFVLSLSESLATELKDTGVTVTALCPGPVDTDFFPKADMIDTNVFQKGNVMAPQEVAQAGYKAAMAGERVIVPGGVNKAMVFARRLMSESAQAKLNQTYYKRPDSPRRRERGDVEKAEQHTS
ncbi:MAG: SDR family oxidoreductase [Nibricoccus sp.]